MGYTNLSLRNINFVHTPPPPSSCATVCPLVRQAATGSSKEVTPASLLREEDQMAVVKAPQSLSFMLDLYSF